MKVYLSVSIMRWNLQYQRYYDYSETGVHPQLSASRAFNSFYKIWSAWCVLSEIQEVQSFDRSQLVHHIDWIRRKGGKRKLEDSHSAHHHRKPHAWYSVFFDFLALTCKHAHFDTFAAFYLDLLAIAWLMFSFELKFICSAGSFPRAPQLSHTHRLQAAL